MTMKRCTRCGAEFDGPGVRCERCKRMMNMYNKNRRDALRAMGRCTLCGKRKPEPGSVLCEECKTVMRERMRARARRTETDAGGPA